MKRNERAAPDWNRRRSAGHQVMVATTVIRIFVADGTDDRDFVRNLRDVRNCLAKVNSRNGGRNGSEFAANFLWRIRLWIERLVMRRPTVQPNHDAIDAVGRSRGVTRNSSAGAQTQEIGETKTERSAEPKLQEVPASHSSAVAFQVNH